MGQTLQNIEFLM